MRIGLVKNLLVLAAVLSVPAVGMAAYVTTVPPAPNNFDGRNFSVTDYGAKCDALNGTGTITSGNLGTFALPPNPQFTFQPTDVGKPIVISGAANWTLNGWVAGGSKYIFNVGYYTACAACGSGGTTFHPTLIGAAGGAQISDSGGLNIIPGGTFVGTGGWNAGTSGAPIGTTPETGTMSTTGSTSNGQFVVSVASTTLQLIGLNGQPVFDTSGSAVSPPIVKNMSISSSSGDIPPGSYVSLVGANSITFAGPNGPATATTGNEIIYIGGYIIAMSQPASGVTLAAADTSRVRRWPRQSAALARAACPSRWQRRRATPFLPMSGGS